jgi:peptidoglycan/xylan/chitin deacetylase (PgdA/CDA1 family)
MGLQIKAPAALSHMRSQFMREVAARALPSNVLLLRGRRERRKRVAITFDDGPDQMTLQYLRVLDRLEMRATFFLLGRNAERRPELTRAIVAAGHEVASHGYSHRTFPALGRRCLVDELIHTADLLPPSPAPRPMVRPPRGALTPQTLLQVAAAGYTTVLWSLDSDDCRTSDAREVEARVAKATPGEIILMHEGQKWTLEALPGIAARLRDQGYETATVGELLYS